MTCCDNPTNKKLNCPVDDNRYSSVSNQTIQHQIKAPWQFSNNDKQFYYCDNPRCDVVYFSKDDERILNNQLQSSKSLLCYCFGVTQQDYALNPSIKNFIINQTKKNQCSCITANPSGKCCLKHFK